MTTFQKGGNIILMQWIFNLCTLFCTIPVNHLTYYTLVWYGPIAFAKDILYANATDYFWPKLKTFYSPYDYDNGRKCKGT